MTMLSLKNLRAGYRDYPVVEPFDLDIAEGEVVSLLGPSGEGKTTILKTIAGLLPPLSGDIYIHQQKITHLPAEQRDIVLIFQKPLLFAFLNVEENIGFGLKMKGIHQDQIQQDVQEMMALTDLKGLEKRKIHQLSGGQQQRVALARGLVLKPAVLLLDEPLSNLDADLRQQMRELINTVCRATGITTIFVTHDQSEALMMSDRVALLLQGALRQTGSPHELFYHPNDRQVATFFGCTNLLTGSVQANRFSNGSLSFPVAQRECTHCTAAIRPERIEILRQPEPGTLQGTITAVQFEGTMTRLQVILGEESLTLLCHRDGYRKGEAIDLKIPRDAVHIIEEE